MNLKDFRIFCLSKFERSNLKDSQIIKKLGSHNSANAGRKGCFGSSKNKKPKFQNYGY